MLTKGTPFLALTGTAGKNTIKNIKRILAIRQDAELICVSPERHNIRIEVNCVKPGNEYSKLQWLVNMMKEKGVDTPKTIIFCNTITEMAALMGFMSSALGDDAYVGGKPKCFSNRLFGLYHSLTHHNYKTKMLDSLKQDIGSVRVVIASSALSMGVNFPDVRFVIHMGPARSIIDHIQQSGRAGRDGCDSHNIVKYHGRQLTHCELAVKDFVKTKNCLHVALYATFGGNVESLEPSHRCCSNCAKKCKCNGDTCAMPELPFQRKGEIVLEYVRSVRTTSQEDKDTLYEALKEYQQTLNGQNLVLFHSSTSTGFTDSLISQIVENCANIFTIKDLENYPFFKIKHSLAVLELIQEIFEDIPDYESTIATLEEAIAANELFPADEQHKHVFPDYFDNSDSESDNPDFVNEELECL